MDHVSRRSLIATATATAAVAGVAAATGSFSSTSVAGAGSPAKTPKASPLSHQVVARVKNLDTGEVDLFIGEKEVTVRDATLAHSIAHAAQQHAV